MNTITARPMAAVREQIGGPLGAVPLTAIVAASGLLLVAFGDTFSRLSIPGATLLWWVGLLAIVVPVGARLLDRDVRRSERLWLLVLLGLGLYIVKVLHSPDAFTMFDEFHHWATLDDVVVTSRLFTPNNILLASPYYPGLEIVGDLLVRSGFSIWEAGVVVVGAARVLMMLVLFLLYERASGSARLAGIATMVYAANPSFLFFDSQFAYESLALPLAVFALWCVLRREATDSGARPASAIALTVCLFLGTAATVVTHHITSIALCGILITWAVIARLIRHRGGAGSGGITGPALVAVIATVAWMLYVASVTVGYLAPAVTGAIEQVIGLIAGEEGGRELFRTATGTGAPALEQLIGYASVVLVLLALPVGLLVLWRRHRGDALMLTLGLIAALYPVTLVGRLAVRAAELAARSTEFVFLGLAFVVAIACLKVLDVTPAVARATLRPAPRPRWQVRLPAAWDPVRLPTLVGAAVVLYMGAAILGIPSWARMPGSYLVSADTRSIEPEGIAAARWALEELGPGRHFLSDRTNRTLLATYGRQHPISAVGDQINVRAPYFDTTLSEDDIRLLHRARVGFVITDMRLPTSLPYVGVYVERGEVNTEGSWETPMSAAALEKWDSLPGVDRIYDGGDIRIFDVGVLTDVDS